MEQTQTPQSKPNFQFQTQNQDFIRSTQSQLMDFSNAFTAGDARKAASFFTPDATLINPVGKRAQGFDEIVRVIDGDMMSFLKGSRSEFRLESSRMLTEDLAFLDLSHSVTGMKIQDGKGPSSMSLHVAVLAKRIDGRWMWIEARPYAYMPETRPSVH